MYDAVMALNVSVISFAVNSGKPISESRVAFSIASCGPLAMGELRAGARSLAQKPSRAYIPIDHSPTSLPAAKGSCSHFTHLSDLRRARAQNAQTSASGQRHALEFCCLAFERRQF